MVALDDDCYFGMQVKTYLRGATYEKVNASPLGCNILNNKF